jgi:hypothetical protein
VKEIKLTLLALTLSAVSTWAQQPMSGSLNAATTQVANPDIQEEQRTVSSTQPQDQERMFGVIPAYGLVDAATQTRPLSSSQKFKLSRQYFNPYTFAFMGVEAGLNQAFNTPKDYGQGAEGYAKRYSAGFADGLTDSIFTTGVYPSILHQDPRYYRLNGAGFWRRTGYAMSRILVTPAGFRAKDAQFFRDSGQLYLVVHCHDLLSGRPERFLACGQSRFRGIRLRRRVQCGEGILS